MICGCWSTRTGEVVMGKSFSSPAAFAAEMAEMDRKLATDTARKATKDQAREAQKIARRAAANDLGGDPKFSGWRPRLATQVKPIRRGGLGHVLIPTKRSAGPWTVAEIGRNKGDGGGGGFIGPGVNRRTGETRRRKDGSVAKVRARKERRWNGYTEGKNTASDAVAEMERKLPPIAAKAVTRQMRRHFDVS